MVKPDEVGKVTQNITIKYFFKVSILINECGSICGEFLIVLTL